MNWFKKAKINLEWTSGNKDGNFTVLMNGKPYTFYNVDRMEDFKWRIDNRSWEHGKIFNELRRGYGNPKLHKKLNPPQELPYDEKQEMMNEFYETGGI